MLFAALFFLGVVAVTDQAVVGGFPLIAAKTGLLKQPSYHYCNDKSRCFSLTNLAAANGDNGGGDDLPTANIVAQEEEEPNDKDTPHRNPDEGLSSSWKTDFRILQCWFVQHETELLLFAMGVWNNAPYVIMLASAKDVAEGGVALVYLASIVPGMCVYACAIV